MVSNGALKGGSMLHGFFMAVAVAVVPAGFILWLGGHWKWPIPRLFRKDTPESLFDDLFAELVKDEEGWEFEGSEGDWVECCHTDTGVVVKFDTYSSKGIRWKHRGNCITLPDGEKIVLDMAQRFRFEEPLNDLLELRNRLKNNKSLAAKKERDLKNLQSMINAYKRMEAKYMHD